MNVVEIIIKATTKAAEKNVKSFEANLSKLGKGAKFAGKALGVLAGGIGAALGIIRSFRADAERLGNTRMVTNIDNMNRSLEKTRDILLDIKIGGGKSVNDVITDAAFGGDMAAKLAAAVAIKAEIDAIDKQLAAGQKVPLTGAGVAGNAEIARKMQENALTKEEIELLKARRKELEQQAAELAKGERVMKSSAKAAEKLRQTFNDRWARASAIRAGDPLALMALGGRGFEMMGPRVDPKARADRGGGSGRVNNAAPVVQVFIGNKPIEGAVQKVLVEKVFKPTTRTINGPRGNRR